jgi:hypothetical protein
MWVAEPIPLRVSQNGLRTLMKLPRRTFLRLATGASALPILSRIDTARAQGYPAKPVRIITHSAPAARPMRCCASSPIG